MVALLAGCQATPNHAPPVTVAEAAGAGERGQAETLREGRRLFVSRCVDCHVLPVVARYPAEAWPHLVAKMAARADLKPREEAKVVSYLVALRKTQK